MTTSRASSLPLRDRRIALSASPKTAARLARQLEELGARVVLVPAIEIRPLGPSDASSGALDSLQRYDWIVFTSANGVAHFLRLARERGIAAQAWRGTRVCAIGPVTARALEEAGIAVSLVPSSFVAEGVAEALAAAEGGLDHFEGKRILLPRAREGRDVLPRLLEAAGATVDVVPCYENVLPDDGGQTAARLRSDPPELLVFTSSSAVTGFARILGPDAAALFERTPVAALGPITAQTARTYSKRVELVPRENTGDALVEAIVERFRQQGEAGR